MNKYCLSKPRKNRFLPKGVYNWIGTSGNGPKKYDYYRVAFKVNGKVKTVGYYDSLFEASQAAIIAHQELYGKKPHWYKDFVQFYKKQAKPLEF